MSRAMFLECFDGDSPFAANKPRPEDLPGFSDGFAAGQAAAQEQAANVNAELASRLSEIQFGYAEARQDLLQGLSPLINAICDQILPSILDDVTRSQVVETLLIAAQTDLSAPTTLSIHPSNAPNLQRLVNGIEAGDVHLVEDLSLGPDEILIGTQFQETQLDVAAMLDALRNALGMIVPPDMRKE